jgi:hypothetical protein
MHESAELIVRRLRPGSLLVKIVGYDRGELGDRPFEEIYNEIKHFKTIDLYVDLADSFGAATPVREAWTEWFRANQAHLRRVSVLVGSKFVEMAVTLAKLFSRTGDLIQLYSSRAAFEEIVGRAQAAQAR